MEEILLNSPLFNNISEPCILPYMSLFEEVEYRANDVIVSQGVITSGAYIVCSGTVNVKLQLFADKELNVARISKGSVFGEISLLDSGPATATIIAKSKCTCLFISREALAVIREMEPELYRTICRNICQVIISRIYDLTKRNKDLEQLGHVKVKKKYKKNQNISPKKVTKGFIAKYNFILSQIYPFNNFSSDELYKVFKHASYIMMDQNEIIFEEGEACGEYFYILLYGSAINYLKKSSMLLNVSAPGGFVGHVGYYNKQKSFCTSFIRERALLLRFERNSFQALKSAHPELYLKLEFALNLSISSTFRSLDKFITNLKLDSLLVR